MSDSARPNRLLLASGSPRRRELLGYLGVAFDASANDAEEQETPPPQAVRAALPSLGAELPLRDHPTLRAWRKADAARHADRDAVVLGADTIVVLGGVAINKPRDAADARRMLRSLSGREHLVITGVALLGPRGAVYLAADESRVTIAELIDAQIDAYVASGEPMDKAGAYGIQGLGGRLVTAVSGSYTNVVGLPLTLVAALLAENAIAMTAAPEDAYRRWLADQQKEPLPCPPTQP